MDLGRETFFVIVSVLRVFSPKAEHRPACAPWGEAAQLSSDPRTWGCQASVPAVLVPRLLVRGGCGPQAAGQDQDFPVLMEVPQCGMFEGAVHGGP